MNSSSFMAGAREEERLLRTRPLLRVVNYHNTPRVQAAQMERDLQKYSQHFSSVNEAELRSYIQTGKWSKPKPGMIPVIYEGYRNGYDTIAPLLEQYGFVGWFFIITGFVNADRRDQVTYAKGHHIGMQTREYPQGRYALNWDEIRELSKQHVIGSHARNHADLSLLSEAERRSEILGSQQEFREHLGRPVLSFSSLRGPAQNDHPEVDTAELVRAAGFEFVFSSYRIQRVGNGVPTAL